MALAAVFLAAFVAVYTIRNGTTGLRRLFAGPAESPQYRPEQYTLPDKPPLDLDDVELLSRLDTEYARLTDAVVPSVVSIDIAGVREQYLLDRAGRRFVRPVPTKGQGSGVIVTREGHVVTNYHVIEGQEEIRVTLHNQDTYPANVIGVDPLLDIAVLKIEAEGVEFQPLKFGDSDQARRGQIVFAIGNPFGLGETITQGIISALERSLRDTQPGLIQTDTAINPGNSGGPLVNLRGEIVGINSAIYRPDDRVNSGFQGVGFSIPSNDVMAALSAILERGRPIRGYLGVSMNPDPRYRQALGYSGSGQLVAHVTEGSPADLAGLKAGDVIVRYAGKEIASLEELFTLVQRSRVGAEVQIDVWRAGEVVTLTTTISEAPPEPEPRPSASTQGRTRDTREVLRAIGVVVRELGGGRAGVVVETIYRGTLAENRLQRGDVIFAINQHRVSSTLDFYQHMAASAAAQTTTLQLLRDGREVRVTLPALPREEESIDDPADSR